MFVEIVHPWLEVVVSAPVKPLFCIASFSLWNLLLARNLLCKWLFSVYNWGWSLHQVLNFGTFNILVRIILCWQRGMLYLYSVVFLAASLASRLPNATSILLVVTWKTVSRHCQMQSKIIPTQHWWTTILHSSYFLRCFSILWSQEWGFLSHDTSFNMWIPQVKFLVPKECYLWWIRS